jgi:hypothetical protein
MRSKDNAHSVTVNPNLLDARLAGVEVSFCMKFVNIGEPMGNNYVCMNPTLDVYTIESSSHIQLLLGTPYIIAGALYNGVFLLIQGHAQWQCGPEF